MRLDRLFATLATALALVASASMPASAQSGGNVSQSAATISSAQFGTLRWLNGDWRGHMPDGNAFHERYRFANDSTIIVTYFETDSAFAHPTRTDSIALRGGVVTKGSSTITRVNDQGVSFVNLSNPASGYDFARLPGGSWTATIRYTKDGKPGKIVYHMMRIR